MEDTPKPKKLNRPLTLLDQKDWFLETFINIVNGSKGMEIGMTLTVGGNIVSGLLVSGEVYFELVAQTMSDNFSEENGRGSIYEAFAAHGHLYREKEMEIAKNTEGYSPTYFHLIDAHHIFPGAQIPTEEGVVWRGKISDVSGFSIGTSVLGKR